MQFGLSESQQILKDTARKFFAGECPSAEVRKLMETGTAYDEPLWLKLAAQGFTGILVPEEYGGMGLGKVELVLLMEEAGYALLPGPLFSTIALGGAVLDAVGTPEQKKKYLPRIASGDIRTTAILIEPGAPSDNQIAIGGGKMTGTKLFVTDAAEANFILIVTSSGVFLADAKAPGIKIGPMKGMDLTRKIYSVKFQNTPVEKLGASANASALTRALDAATTALAAEMVGGMQRTLELTVAYAKTRKQFGKPIGTFQAVQHMCADMYLETESARSAAYYAAWALEENAPDAAVAVSIAKVYASDACRTVGNRGIQVYGGMGFTWENDLHLYYRRAKASETMLGDATFHRERIARLIIDGVAPAANKKDATPELVAKR